MVRRLALLCTLALPLALAPPALATFPGSNGELAFSRAPSGGESEIWALAPGGSPFRLLPVPSGGPAWSPDGRRIAFAAASGMTQAIWVMNADGSGAQQITHLDFFAFHPTWSPDNAHIAFAHGADGTDGIFIANADGSGTPSPVPGTQPADEFPAWSPDGRRIAFINGNDLWVMNADGSNRAPLHQPAMGKDADPSWSPDGGTVYFDFGSNVGGCSSPHQILAVAAAGGAALPVSVEPDPRDYQPAPSPDGTLIAFSRCEEPSGVPNRLYAMPIGGGPISPLTRDAGVEDGSPDWQPAPPVFASAPSIAGGAVNNQTLTATAGASPGGGSTVLQFVRCNAQGAGCVDIAGARASRVRAAASSLSYRLTSADLGHAVRVRQTQTNALGSSSLESAPTAPVVPSGARCTNLFAGTVRGDRIAGSAGSDRLSGGRGNDRLSGLGAGDCISGGSGRDRLSGGTGGDRVSGGSGNDRLSGGSGNDSLSGGSGRDSIQGGSGRNKVSGGSGNDTINVRNHRRDRVNCGKGRRDRVRADRRDRLRGCERVRRSRR